MIFPRNDTIVVKLPKPQERLVKSGLFIPAMVQEPAPEATILAFGPKLSGFFDEHGVKVGDRVLFEQYAGLEFEDKEWGLVILILPKDLKAQIS
jgi:co-chaperonin GroES (HSP10)